MGEYVKLDGESYKIGTCESLYYCRYDDLREWIAAGRATLSDGNEKPAEYLKGAYRFRFPFPDEDGAEAERIDAYGRDYERGVTIEAPAELFEEMDHTTLCKWIGPAGIEHYGVNVIIPCPLGPDFDQVQHSPAPTLYHLEIVQQRPYEGALWCVVRCAWCGAMWRLDPQRGRRLAAHIIEHGRAVLETGYPLRFFGEKSKGDDDGQELARRIVAGYETAS